MIAEYLKNGSTDFHQTYVIFGQKPSKTYFLPVAFDDVIKST